MPSKYPTSININPVLWKRAKIEALNRGITVTQLLERALESELNKSNDKTFHNIASKTLEPSAITPSREIRTNPSSGKTVNTLKIVPAQEGSLEQFRNRIESAVSGTTFRAIADVYNSRDKKVLRPQFLKAVYDISRRDKKPCVNEREALRNTGLGGYLEGIIPHVVADLKEDGLIEYCENRGEIRLTQTGKDEITKNASN
jgi:hypothetical protein